jgi:hypothetical protein
MKLRSEDTEAEDTEAEAAEEKGRREERGKERGNKVRIQLALYVDVGSDTHKILHISVERGSCFV